MAKKVEQAQGSAPLCTGSVQHFALAETLRKLAKTDQLDDQVLAHFGVATRPAPRPLPDAQARELEAPVARRRQVLRTHAAELQRRQRALLLVQRRITSQDALEQLCWLFLVRGTPGYIRSDNGPEFTAKAVRKWLQRLGVKTLFIEPGSPWENGYIESFNGKLRDELLGHEIFNTLLEAETMIKEWRKEYNQVRLHSSVGYRPPAPQAMQPYNIVPALS